MPDVSESALRDGLRGLPVPAVSPDFDDCILAALHKPQPWWQRLWQPARPLLAGASFSLIVTLALLHWTLSAPVAPPQATPLMATSPVHAPSLDALLNLPNLSAGALTTAWNSPLEATPPDDRRPHPHRRAQVFRRPCPIA